MEERIDEIMQSIILQALKDNPDGLTQRQIERLVKKKMKKLKKNTHWKENQKKIIPMRFVVKKV